MKIVWSDWLIRCLLKPENKQYQPFCFRCRDTMGDQLDSFDS